MITEATRSTLAFLAGSLAGAADKHFGTRTYWTMKVYMDMQAGKLTLGYLYRLEKRFIQIWPKGETPPTIANILNKSLVLKEVLCGRCGNEFLTRLSHTKPIGELPSDPGWLYRLTFGQARQPTQEQRTIGVNGIPHYLSTDHYTCDLCDAKILPGQNACCRTMHRDGEAAPDWEFEYLNPPTSWGVANG